MFNQEFFPTPNDVIMRMLEGLQFTDKTFLEPSAGKGDIIDAIKSLGGSVIACESNQDLKKIIGSKCQIIADDFFSVTSDQISHIHYIVMNPPFSNADKHILHAWDIAPAGCKIVALCNSNTLTEKYSEIRRRLSIIIEESGETENLGNCFNESERRTNVDVSMIHLQKPGASYESEFEGFFMEDEQEAQTGAGLMPYNVVRDLVNRYVAAVKIFDEQLNAAVRMNELTSGFYRSDIGMSISADKKPLQRNEFKKEMQKSGWNFIFNKMNMQKYATQGLKADINKFVEQQQNIPFTMKNIYRMIDIVVGTTGQRMDKAIIEVFDRVTERHHENRYNLPGWKTNSHYLINEKFIIDYIVEPNYSGEMRCTYNGWSENINDMVKALCYITGTDYNQTTPLNSFINNIGCTWGQWYSWGFFEIRGYKKGTMHFKFQNQDLWAQFNQHVARIKGYPLPESKPTEKKKQQKAPKQEQPKKSPVILSTIKIGESNQVVMDM